jgi:hypothetical protein
VALVLLINIGLASIPPPTYTPSMFDDLNTADDNQSSLVTDAYWARLRRMSIEERLERSLALCDITRKFVMAGILQRNPGIDPHEIRMRFAALTLGRDFTVRQYGWDPDVHGY